MLLIDRQALEHVTAQQVSVAPSAPSIVLSPPTRIKEQDSAGTGQMRGAARQHSREGTEGQGGAQPRELIGGVEPAEADARAIVVDVIHLLAQLAGVWLEQLRDPAAVVGPLDEHECAFFERHHLRIAPRFRLWYVSVCSGKRH